MAKTGFWLRGAKGKLASQRLASGGDERRERLSAAGGAGQWWLGWLRDRRVAPKLRVKMCRALPEGEGRRWKVEVGGMILQNSKL